MTRPLLTPLRAGLVGLAALVVGAGLLPAAAAPAPVTLRGPSAHGLVELGDRVRADLGGDCRRASTRVVARFGSTTVQGPAVAGCFPVVTVPAESALAARGYRPGVPVALEVVSGQARQPLVLSRLEPQAGEVAAGAPTPVPAVTDPFGGGGGLTMSTGDTVDLGVADLAGVQSVSVRHLSSTVGVWELRAGSASGRAIATGQFGPAGNIGSAAAEGWLHSVGKLELRPAAAVVGDTNTFADLTTDVPDAPRLFLAVVAAVEPVVVNWVDLNGPGAALPHRFGSERGFEVIFDGSSFDGWSHVGPGRFELRDGAMRAQNDLGDRGWAWLWWTREQFSDHVVRLRFKVEDYMDNGGVLLRHRDPQEDPNRSTASGDEVQIQESFENHTGGIAHEADAFRLATYMVGDWNDLEVVAVGPTYVVRINGSEVQRYTSTKQLRGFFSVENEQLFGVADSGHLWYDDIRVHRCTPADALCRL